MFKAKLNIVRSERERERKNQLTVRRRHSKKEYNKSDRERVSERERAQEKNPAHNRRGGRGQRTMLVVCGRGSGNLITLDKKILL